MQEGELDLRETFVEVFHAVTHSGKPVWGVAVLVADALGTAGGYITLHQPVRCLPGDP